MRRIATLCTGKPRLTDPIRSLDMSAAVAALARVPWVHQDDRHASERRLVFDKGAELRESPASHSGALWLPKPRPRADMRQRFKRNTSLGAFGRRNERLTDTVIDVTPESRFFLGHALQRLSNLLGALPAHLGHGARTLQALAALRVACPTGFHRVPTVRRAIRGCCQVDDAQIHTKHVLRSKQGGFGHLDGTQQIPGTASIHQIGLPFDTPLPGALIGATDKRHLNTSTDGPQARRAQPVEAQHALVVADRAIRAERWTDRLVPLETLDRLGNRTYRHLRRQGKRGAHLVVHQMVQGDLPKQPRRKARLCGIGGSRVERGHRGAQGVGLGMRRQESELQGQFHNENIVYLSLIHEEALPRGMGKPLSSPP